MEEIVDSAQETNPSLFDPHTGNKVQTRRKIVCRLDKELESSGSIFTGRDETQIIKRKRQRDAEAYQKILREQIEEKNKRKLKSNMTDQRGRQKFPAEEKQKSNSNNTSAVQDKSPIVTSSRYSNSNTACTRNLFTPSEDNCLSQHLASHQNKKIRVVGNSDCVNILSDKNARKTPTI